MSTPAEAREKFISNYCDELEKTLKDVQRVVRKNIGEAQRKQKKAYDCRNSVEKETPFKQGDRVWLNDRRKPMIVAIVSRKRRHSSKAIASGSTTPATPCRVTTSLTNALATVSAL